jgi:AraC-like DNA-binding protein
MIRGNQFTLLHCRMCGVEAVEADTAFAFGRHTHEQFGVGLIHRGAQKSASGRGPVEAGPGDLITVNPGEVHDGAPIGDRGRGWRMLYLDPAIIASAMADASEGRINNAVEFGHPAIRDARLAALFRRLFRLMTQAPAPARPGLALDESLLLVLGELLQPGARRQAAVPGGIASALALIHDCPAQALTLTDLARGAGLSRYQFLRGFARATGLTPHAYIMQRRLHRARGLIGKGAALSDAALESGFADQSHMTRLFVRSFGMAPGAYARAVA